MDDLAVLLLLHRRRDGANQIERSLKLALQVPLEIRPGQIGELDRRDLDGRTVHQYGDLPQPARHGVNHRFDVWLAGNVRATQAGAAAGSDNPVNRRLRGRGVGQMMDRDREALGAQRLANRRADPARAAHDERNTGRGHVGRSGGRRFLLDDLDLGDALRDDLSILVRDRSAQLDHLRAIVLREDLGADREGVANTHRQEELETLRKPQGAVARQLRADDGGDERGAQHPVSDRLLERRSGRKRRIDVKAIGIARQIHEALHVVRRELMHDLGGLANLDFRERHCSSSQSRAVPFGTSRRTARPSTCARCLGGRPHPGRIARTLSGVSTSPAFRSARRRASGGTAGISFRRRAP